MLLPASCATAPRGYVGDLSVEQLKEAMDSRQDLMVVDTRTEYEYRQGRIPGSVLIAPHRFDELDVLLPSNKSTRLVFYCRGAG
jgi:rhodanese-related sulfurtransferase